MRENGWWPTRGVPPPSPGGWDAGGWDTGAGPTSLPRPGDLRYFWRGMWTHRAALPLDLLLVACRAYGRSDVALRRDFAGVEINRIGDHRPFYSHYEVVVLLDALHRVLRAGVTEEALEVATVAPAHGIGVARLPAPHGYPSYTRERWPRIAGCDSLVYMKANARGRVFSVHGKGGCLKPGALSKSEVYRSFKERLRSAPRSVSRAARGCSSAGAARRSRRAPRAGRAPPAG